MEKIEYSGAGVYAIYIDDHIYVGSSINIKKRIKYHYNAAKNGKEPKKLQDAFDSAREMHVDILEKIEDNKTINYLFEREKYWIDALRADLNAAPPGGLYDHAEEIKRCIQTAEMHEKLARDNREYAQKLEKRYFSTIGSARNGNRQKET